MQYLADQLVRNMLAVARGSRAWREPDTSDFYRRVTILRWAKPARARELNGTIADPLYDAVPKRKRV
jgi:hypothetical protein